MEEASRWFVDLDELNAKAGEIIARLTGADAGLVTAGSAAGMLLEAAACMTGGDPAKVQQLPDTTGMKNEIVIQWAHRVSYDNAFRTAGAKLIQIGGVGATHSWELEMAINENTAAVAHVFASPAQGSLPLSQVVEIAHARGVPVIVDAAAMLPPPENLTRYIAMGADMVSYSGGKGVRGPQSTGILCGRNDLIEAAYANSSPNSYAVGRAAKVCKEEIAGLVTALEMFVDTDHQALMVNWRAHCQHIVEALQDIEGVRPALADAMPDLDEFESSTPRAFVHLEPSYKGPGQGEIIDRLANGDPAVRVLPLGGDDWLPTVGTGVVVSPVNLLDGEAEIMARRLREVLTGGR
jgi:L-seryl-tRNA(Ser) seleniumtransferase